MRKKPSTIKDILFLSISSFVVIAAWIGFNLYHSWVTSTITPDLQVQISPINPDFDTVTLDKLKTRKQVVPVSTLSNKITVEPTTAIQPNTGSTAISPTPITASPTQTLPANDIPVTVNGQ